VARVLRARGHEAVVPDLRSVALAEAPFWPLVAELVIRSMDELSASGPVVLVAHSNAGLLLPAVAETSSRPVAGAVYVDAALPARPGPSAAAPATMLEQLRAMADPDGRLPRWSDWWTPADVGELIHDAQVRGEVLAEQPRLPLAYYEQLLPVPVSWWSVPTAYLRLSEAYDEELDTATRDDWPTASLQGKHLHQVVDPVAVAESLVTLAERLGL
jgi:alpha-beta hydrolase superfamily lysophospholipase